MWKNSIYLTLLFFVFGLAWTGPANAADPTLQLWLELEDNANDSSNYARPTTVTGTLDYGPGVIGQGADFGGNANYVTIAGWKGILGQSAFTVSAWCLPDVGNNGHFAAWGAHHSGADASNIQFRSNNDRLRVEHGSGDLQGDTVWNQDGEWHHVAVTHAAGATLQHPGTKLYLDGWDDTRLSTGDGSTTNIQPELDLRIGIRHSSTARNLNSWFDDVRIYDRELSADEIRILAGNVEPILDSPADEATLAAPGATLKWAPGVYAANVDGHEVYLGDNYEDVNTGTGTLVATLNGDVNSCLVDLSMGKLYYWKVDAVNDSHPDVRWSSEIWSFTVPPYEAWDPFPPDKQKFVDPNVTLSWKMGMGGYKSDVYFGTNFDDVNDANTLTVGIYKGQQTEIIYSPAGLAYDANYYWRIDTYPTVGPMAKGAVWSFKTYAFTPITDDPNLVGYWKLDDLPSGVVAIDSSGYNHYGRLRNGASYVAGFMDQAVEFDGEDDYISMDNYKGILGGASRTVCMWIKTADAGGPAPGNGRGMVGWGNNSAGERWELVVNKQSGSGRIIDAPRVNVNDGWRTGTTLLTDSEWHHVAATLYDDGSPNANELQLYVDGAEESYSGTSGQAIDTASNFDMRIGNGVRGGDQVLHFGGLIDEVRLYDRALSPDEVQNIMDPAKAYKPSPTDGEMDVPLSAKLIWSPGTDEITGSPYTKHDVYFSTNFQDVNAGTVARIEVVGGVNEVTPSLDYYNYYYWRVDGINAGGQPNRGFIWSFKATYNPALVVDPNLLAWYKLDGDANDSSGYGRDLIVTGEPLYAGGVEDLAMELDGNNNNGPYGVYQFPTEEWLEYTVMGWAKLDGLPGENNESVFSSFSTDTDGFQIDVNGTSQTYRWHGENEQGTIGPAATEWVHLAVAYDGARATLFYNGNRVDPVVNTAEGTFNKFCVGANRTLGTRFGGKIDDVRIYDRELFDAEILEAMRGDNLARAWKPKPGHEATGVEREPTLSWTPGDYAPPTNGHYVYFGADDPCNLTLVPDQPQSPNNYSPGVLDLERTYYWVVDEANAGDVNPGKIWSFTTTDHLLVDDMEAYNAWDAAPPYIFEIWVDGSGNCDAIAGNGTGSLVDFVADPCTPVLSGSQSMKLEYDNDGMAYNPCPDVQKDEPRAYYSKIVAQVGDFPSGVSSNWTAGGAKALSLQFFGDVNNVVEAMWIQLSDGTGPGAKVTYGDYDDEDPADVNDESWHEWNIALDDFTGVDAANVKSITIGVGDENATSPASTGTLYFDDIRLYTPRCFPLRAKSPADFDTSDNRCVVDYADLKVLTNDWLLSTYDFTVADSVSDANLEAHYAFEDNLLDSSANLRHAVPNGTISYAAGKIGAYAVDFDGTNYAEVTGYKGVTGTQDRTCTAWIKTASPGEIVIWGMNTSALKWLWRIQDAGAIRLEVGTGSTVGKTDLRDDQWHHVAVVLESAGSPRVADLKLYVDGLLEAPSSLEDNDVNTSSDTDVRIGKGPFNERPFIGQIDELRIYSRALEQAEVANLAGLAGTVTQPLLLLLTTTENTDLFDDETINFKDYARLLDAWLDVVFWP